jgi:hypothetical protein
MHTHDDTTPARSPLSAWRSFWRTTDRRSRVLALLLIAYIVVITVMRFWGAHREWASEGDWRQWIFTYWRNHDSTLLPGENLLTDYLDAMQPPLYRLMMATFSTVLVPTKAAFLVSIIAWGAFLAALWWGFEKRFGVLLALVVIALTVRNVEIFNWSAGGYPRSFGPPLTAWFIMALLYGRHRLMLVLFVIGAGLYPSVVMPAGLAYGAWLLGKVVLDVVDVRWWWRRVLELCAAGVLVVVLGLSQNLLAPAWWGKVMSASQGGVELSSIGRWSWLPLPHFWHSMLKWLIEPFGASGWITIKSFSPIAWPTKTLVPAVQVWIAVVAVAALVVLWRRARCEIPWRFALYGVGVVIAYALARALAFKLYLPRRVIQHTLPILSVVVVAWLVASAARALWRRREVAAVMLLVVLPTIVLAGDGIQGSRCFGDKERWAPLFLWARNETPKDAQFAGDLAMMDWIPLFAPRHAYVNFTLAHPVRPGFYAEVERRILREYDAVYATDLPAVLAFMDEADVDYFIVDKTSFTRVESGWGRLYEPVRTKVAQQFFTPRKAQGFVLAQPPASAVVFTLDEFVVVGREALRTTLATPPR